jgi:hypothetical protein
LVLIGFPPPDFDLREWLVPSGSVSSDQSAAQKRLHGFVYSLLNVTCTALEIIVMENKGSYLRLWLLPELGANCIADAPLLPNVDNLDIENMSESEREEHASYVKVRQAWLAKTFRKLMTTGQSFTISNTYRNTFYKSVTDLADDVNYFTFLFFF